nr:MAG TPA: hypothetical protein [Caudoviricetes sp.]
MQQEYTMGYDTPSQPQPLIAYDFLVVKSTVCNITLHPPLQPPDPPKSPYRTVPIRTQSHPT